jgi:AraC family transcriptional regulator
MQRIINRFSQNQPVDAYRPARNQLAGLRGDGAPRWTTSSQEHELVGSVESRCLVLAPTDCSILSAKERLAISIFLRAARATIVTDGTVLYDGVIPAGSALVVLPGQEATGAFAERVELIQLDVEWDFVTQHTGMDPTSSCTSFFGLFRDEPIANLARAMEYCSLNGCAPGWAERLSAFMVARLFHLYSRKLGEKADRSRIAMPLWRIRRVNEYLESHLSETVSLADLARVAGLSPMHFAAQFRLATGHRPHEYLQLRRIERAKHLLLQPSVSLIDIAMQVGFRTQSHFTTVFKRYVGKAPSYWRDQQLMHVA